MDLAYNYNDYLILILLLFISLCLIFLSLFLIIFIYWDIWARKTICLFKILFKKYQIRSNEIQYMFKVYKNLENVSKNFKEQIINNYFLMCEEYEKKIKELNDLFSSNSFYIFKLRRIKKIFYSSLNLDAKLDELYYLINKKLSIKKCLVDYKIFLIKSYNKVINDYKVFLYSNKKVLEYKKFKDLEIYCRNISKRIEISIFEGDFQKCFEELNLFYKAIDSIMKINYFFPIFLNSINNIIPNKLEEINAIELPLIIKNEKIYIDYYSDLESKFQTAKVKFNKNIEEKILKFKKSIYNIELEKIFDQYLDLLKFIDEIQYKLVNTYQYKGKEINNFIYYFEEIIEFENYLVNINNLFSVEFKKFISLNENKGIKLDKILAKIKLSLELINEIKNNKIKLFNKTINYQLFLNKFINFYTIKIEIIKNLDFIKNSLKEFYIRKEYLNKRIKILDINFALLVKKSLNNLDFKIIFKHFSKNIRQLKQDLLFYNDENISKNKIIFKKILILENIFKKLKHKIFNILLLKKIIDSGIYKDNECNYKKTNIN